MSKILLLLALLCGSAFAEDTEETKQKKRGLLSSGSDGWIGISNPYTYGHGQPWAADPNPWKPIKGIVETPGWNYDSLGSISSYGHGASFSLSPAKPSVIKTVPVYITKHVVLEKPEPVIAPQPYIVPVEKVVPITVEKIIHRPVPFPVPITQTVPVPVEHAVPIPVKHPVAIPVQQPYPVPIKQTVHVPVPVPVPFPLTPAFAAIPAKGFYGPGGLIGGPYYDRGYGAGFYGPLHGHGLLTHGFGQDLGHGYGHGFDHGHVLAYGVAHGVANVDHGHLHKKRSKDNSNQ